MEPPESFLVYEGGEFIVPNHSRGEEPYLDIEIGERLKVRPNISLQGKVGMSNCEIL